MKLDGYKTYVLALLGVIYVVGSWLGYWELHEEVMAGLGFGAVATLRNGIKKVEPKPNKPEMPDSASNGT